MAAKIRRRKSSLDSTPEFFLSQSSPLHGSKNSTPEKLFDSTPEFFLSHSSPLHGSNSSSPKKEMPQSEIMPKNIQEISQENKNLEKLNVKENLMLKIMQMRRIVIIILLLK